MGDVCYDSHKMFRSNAEFDRFKDTNRTSLRVVVLLLTASEEGVAAEFPTANELFMPGWHAEVAAADIFLYAREVPKFKFLRARKFFIRPTGLLMMRRDGSPRTLVRNAVLECTWAYTSSC